MKGKIAAILFGLLLVMPMVVADHNRYDPFVDLGQINWFDRAIYFGAEPHLPCLDLNEFYAYADSDPYDGFDRDDIRKNDLKRLNYRDFLQIADADQYDNIDRDLFDGPEDFACSLLEEYEDFAARDSFDRFDREDYFVMRGFPDERGFQNWRRHFPYERRPVVEPFFNEDPYGRFDGYGGYASWVR